MIKRYRYKYEDMYELRITECETRGRKYVNARVDKQKQAPKFTPILKEHEYHREYLQVMERKDAGRNDKPTIDRIYTTNGRSGASKILF